MRDRDIRDDLRAHLAVLHATPDAEPLIIDELEVCAGSVRADIAVINGVLAGYEIKSERDTLLRLGSQVQAYNRVFERATLVAAASHVEPAAKLIPDWWGIYGVEIAARGVSISPLRLPGPNPEIDPHAVGMLLWRHEALRLLESLGLDRGCRSKPVTCMVSRLCENLAVADVARHVRTILKARGDWRAAARQKRCDGSCRPSPSPAVAQ